VVLFSLVSANIGSASYGKLLLCSILASCELCVADVPLIHDVAMVRGLQQGVHGNIAKANGTDGSKTNTTFGKVCSEMETISKKPANGKALDIGYLFKQVTAGM
jgi:hypothetical protein